MEEQHASLAHVLLKDPELDLDTAVEEFRQRLAAALRPLSDEVIVHVIRHGDLVAITPEMRGADSALKESLLATIYQVKADWIQDLNAHADR